jgi:uncharacterized caspase-like protein
LVGINRYEASPLRGPVNDIWGFAQLLADRAHVLASDVSVTQLLDEYTTLSNLRSAVETLATAVAADDMVIFYFSGHQTNVPAESGSNASVKALLPYDFKGAHFLKVPDLVQWLGKVPAKQQILIADV